MITLHYYPGYASMTPHIVLREIGVSFTLRYVDCARDAHKSAAYLALNPNGLIPVLQDGDLVLYETAAILLHLVDTHPQAGLAPPPGSAARAAFNQWLVWLVSTWHAQVPLYFYSERYVAPGNPACAAAIKAQAERSTGTLIDRLDARLAQQPWMAGDAYSALDAYTFMLCRWTRGFARPASALPNVGPYLTRMLARPAVQATLRAEELESPFV